MLHTQDRLIILLASLARLGPARWSPRNGALRDEIITQALWDWSQSSLSKIATAEAPKRRSSRLLRSSGAHSTSSVSGLSFLTNL